MKTTSRLLLTGLVTTLLTQCGDKELSPNEKMSQATFIKAMESLKFPPDMFGSAELTFGPAKRAGSDMTRMSQLQDERWKPVTEYVKPQ